MKLRISESFIAAIILTVMSTLAAAQATNSANKQIAVKIYLQKTLSKAAQLTVCLLAVLLAGAACGVVKNPLRDYSEKPFNSQEWLAGDAIERGRMFGNVFKNGIVTGKSKKDVRRLFGEPDKKTTVENREIWLYRVDNGHNQALPYFPISFDEQRGTFVGRVKGGTISLLVAE